MKSFVFISLLILINLNGCKPPQTESANSLDSARRANSLAQLSQNSTGNYSSPSYEPPLLTYRTTYLADDSVENEAAVLPTSSSSVQLPPLTPVELITKTNSYRGEDCPYYIYRVSVSPDSIGWVQGSDLAIAANFLPRTELTYAAKNYTIFSVEPNIESGDMACGDSWMVLVYAHAENKIYPVTASGLDEQMKFGFAISSETPSLEFTRTMAYPGITSVELSGEGIDLLLRMSYMDNSSRDYRLTMTISENGFDITKYVLESDNTIQEGDSTSGN